jgi:hypothetical protein
MYKIIECRTRHWKPLKTVIPVRYTYNVSITNSQKWLKTIVNAKHIRRGKVQRCQVRQLVGWHQMWPRGNVIDPGQKDNGADANRADPWDVVLFRDPSGTIVKVVVATPSHHSRLFGARVRRRRAISVHFRHSIPAVDGYRKSSRGVCDAPQE